VKSIGRAKERKTTEYEGKKVTCYDLPDLKRLLKGKRTNKA